MSNEPNRKGAQVPFIQDIACRNRLNNMNPQTVHVQIVGLSLADTEEPTGIVTIKELDREYVHPAPGLEGSLEPLDRVSRTYTVSMPLAKAEKLTLGEKLWLRVSPESIWLTKGYVPE